MPAVTNRLRCSYSEGMFSNEPVKASRFAIPNELTNACFHEAGHAVLGYLSGYGIISLGVCAHYERNDHGQPTVAFSGLVEFDKRRFGLFSNVVEFPYRFAHFREGVISAAGPAAERRSRFERQDSQRLIVASEADHGQISTIAKCLARRGRSRFAYQEHVWRWAQRAISDDAIWSAITDVADWLYEEASSADDWNGEGEPPHSESWSRLGVSDTYLACRRNGLRKGMYAKRAIPSR